MRPVTPAESARWRAAGLAIVVVLFALHMLGGWHTAGVADFWRDLYWATRIAHGEAFPLAGPPIYGLVELGPWWFYVLALPIGLFGSVAAAAVFVQVLAACKYAIAWRLGARAVDERFGCLFAASLAIAGWSTIPLMFPSHTAVVEATLLLLAATVWRGWSRFTILDGVLFGLASGACLTAHPTTASYVVAAGVALLLRHRSRRVVAFLALAALVAVAMLAPPWLDTSPVVAMHSMSAYVGSDLAHRLATRIPRLVASVAVDGAWNGFLLMTRWPIDVVHAAWIVWCAGLVVAAVGLVSVRHAPKWRNTAAFAALALVAQATFLCILRPVTPMWMTSSLLPPFALLVAIGWNGALAADRVALRRVATVAFVLFVALSLVPFGLFLRNVVALRVTPGANPFYDVIDTADRFAETPVPYYPAHRHDRLAAALCAPAVLHGRLAAIVGDALAVPERLHCGAWPDLRLAGRAGDVPHVAGVFARAVDAIGIAPDRVVAGMALYDHPVPIAPASGDRPAQLQRGQVYAFAADEEPKTFALEFDADAADVAVLTNRFPTAMPLTIRRISADGHDAIQRFDDGGSSAYGCDRCTAGTRVHWRFDLTGVEDDLDLVVLPARR